MAKQETTKWQKLTADTKRLQQILAQKVIAYDDFATRKISTVCGFDASYNQQIAYCSAVVLRAKHKPIGGFEVVEALDNCIREVQPYVPGMFMLREGKPALDTVKKVKTKFDVLLIDGHGILHPRRCGLASYIGVILDNPTIGVAKKLLCGIERNDGFIEYEGQVLGFALGMKNKIYI